MIEIPNGSFESPATPSYTINIDHWQKGPKPDWYLEGGGFLWTQQTGAFKNTSEGSFDHLDNCDGNQAAWLFAVPEVSLFQDYDSVDWNDSGPTHAFDAKFEAGKSYTLTVGVNGSGGGMSNGVTMEISLYYRDIASNVVTVAATSITNTPENFPNHTHFSDYQVQVSPVKASDPWAGQHIGIHLLSTVSTNLQGGYWDLDNVRLFATVPPTITAVAANEGQVELTVLGEPGHKVQIYASPDLAVPFSGWTSLDVVTNLTGNVRFTDNVTTNRERFYQVKQSPQ